MTKKRTFSPLFFDKQDYRLLDIVHDVLERGEQSRSLHSMFAENMHPRGIKEMAAPQGLRIAYAVAVLLGSFDKGKAPDRLRALQSLRDEVFLSSAGTLQKNTARVQLQIMKELLRCREDKLQQVRLAHDFRMVSTGNPRKVRAELARYHLLEMPEAWNQYAFDDRVHDANSKGRKSPTHLVMDAWIKGIRHLTVVYYNHVAPAVVEELLEAASILNVHVRVGIEYWAHFQDKYARFTWVPHGFKDTRTFLSFLDDPSVKTLMEAGQEVSRYQQQYVFDVLENFNATHRHTLNSESGVEIAHLSRVEFLEFIGTGQPTIVHLSRFIHNLYLQRVKEHLPALLDQLGSQVKADREAASLRLERLRRVTVESIVDRFLTSSNNPGIHNPGQPSTDERVPALLRSTPYQLLSRLLSLHSSSSLVLSLSNLSVQDTMELLFVGEGMISHIESYNLKDAVHGMRSDSATGAESVALKSPGHHYRLISDLQRALTDDNVISLKKVIREIIWDFEEQLLRLKKHIELLPDQKPEKKLRAKELLVMVDRKERLMRILSSLERFHHYYRKSTLKSCIGSGSTGQAEHRHGMGLVVLDTLPQRARRAFAQAAGEGRRTLLPVSALLTRVSYTRFHQALTINKGRRKTTRFAHIAGLISNRQHDWTLDGFVFNPQLSANIATLGGLTENGELNKLLTTHAQKERQQHSWRYLNTHLRNTLKVLLGFLPAFCTFYLTKDWWVLAYLGAVIWFAITGSRNIIQSVLGGGGIRRSPLLPWNSLVSWSRIADSLLYTGFSVPLLDFLVKTLLLDKGMGITTSTNPVLLYAVMGLANGLYISSHNLFRGLPRSAAAGNFFRSILAIPLAILLNSLVGSFLVLGGSPDPAAMLQKWAAIISKFASDCVAGVIEGLADRQVNVRQQMAAYRVKIVQLFAVFSRLDLLFPEQEVLTLLESPEKLMATLGEQAAEQEKLLIVNALDLMYFWMYRPRARKALEGILEEMSREEWLIFYRSQLVLSRHREISQVFVDGLVGRNFSKALSFYLDRSKAYLEDLQHIDTTRKMA